MKRAYVGKCIIYVLGVLIPYTLILKGATKQKKEPQVSAQEFDQNIYQWSKIIAETCHLIKQKYVTLPNPEKSFIGALNAFTHSLDPHSTFLDKKAYESIKESVKGELCGIGVIIDNTKETEDEFIRIVDTIPAGPADKAGIKAEDKILEIDGESVKGMALEEAISKIKGKKGSSVSARIQRSDTTRHLNFSITRDIVQEPNALSFYIPEQDVYYVCLNMFTENAVSQMEELLNTIKKSPAQGFILDLRNNSGGLLHAVVSIAGFFLPKNSLVVSTKGRNNIEFERYTTLRNPIFSEIQFPIIILVNNYTASAAEILAGCLQIHAQDKHLNRPIFVIGSQTFGKSSVQTVIPLTNDADCNCALKITTGLYYLPDDQSIQGIGVIPDFIVEQRVLPSEETMWFNEKFGRESSLKNAIKNDQKISNPLAAKTKSKKENEQEKSWLEKKKELIAKDYTIVSAVRIIGMYNMAKKATPKTMAARTNAIDTLKKAYLPEEGLKLTEIANKPAIK